MLCLGCEIRLEVLDHMVVIDEFLLCVMLSALCFVAVVSLVPSSLIC
jgi:hypothetical protein